MIVNASSKGRKCQLSKQPWGKNFIIISILVDRVTNSSYSPMEKNKKGSCEKYINFPICILILNMDKFYIYVGGILNSKSFLFEVSAYTC